MLHPPTPTCIHQLTMTHDHMGSALGPTLTDEEKGRTSHHEHRAVHGVPEGLPAYDEKQRQAEVLHEVGEVAAVGEVATDAYGVFGWSRG